MLNHAAPDNMSNRSHRTILPHTYVALYLLLIELFLIKRAIASSAPFLPQTIKRFVSNRCQNPITPSSAIWSWEGRLVDPSNGNVIANVEGIELVRILSEIEKPPPSPSSSTVVNSNNNTHTRIKENEVRASSLWNVARGFRRLHDLKVKKMLTTDRNWEYAGTVLSRKLFCYSPVSGKNKSSLLTEYKHHPNAPTRKVQTEEAVALFDTATTFVSRDNGKEMHLVTEWPDGRWVQSEASVGLIDGTHYDDDDDDDSSSGLSHDSKKKSSAGNRKRFPFGYTAYVRRSGRNQLPTLPEKKSEKMGVEGKKASIPRSKFIQFGKDEDSENYRFGARETYTYILGNGGRRNSPKRYKRAIKEAISSFGEQIGLWDFGFDSENEDDNTTVQYVRYGEAPPFYAPGKMCTLELFGKRVDSVTDAPPLAATLAATRVPGFMSVHTPITFNDNVKNLRSKTKGGLDEKKLKELMIQDTAAINAVKWFRGNEGSLPLQVLSDNDGQEEDVFNKFVNKGLNALQKVRVATTLTAATENSS